MERSIVILLLGLVVGSSRGQGPLGNDWTQGLTQSINQLTANIQSNVQQLNQQIQKNVQQLNQQIQANVRGNLEQIDRLNSDISQRIEDANLHGTTIGNNGATIVVNGGTGSSSKTVFSGYTPNGERYFRESNDRVIGDILHHSERVYNPTRKSMDEFRYTLDLKDPNAKPVLVQ